MLYLRELASVLLRLRFLWWLSLIVAPYVGIGWFADYSAIKATFQRYGFSLPDEFPMIWIVIATLVWLVLALAHKEVMSNLRAARIVLDPPEILQRVPLFGNVLVYSDEPVSQQIGENDIVYVVVRNRPHEMSDGKAVKKAYGSVSVCRLTDGKDIINFDFARWMDNEKPGYEGNPSDRYRDEWNYRTIEPNHSPNRLDFVVKSRNENNAYGFRGQSQRVNGWHDEELMIPPGRYKIMLTLFGTGMKEPYRACYEFTNHGAEEEMDIRRTDRGLSTKWLQANT